MYVKNLNQNVNFIRLFSFSKSFYQIKPISMNLIKKNLLKIINNYSSNSKQEINNTNVIFPLQSQEKPFPLNDTLSEVFLNKLLFYYEMQFVHSTKALLISLCGIIIYLIKCLLL